MFYRTNYNSKLGKITIASDGENIVGLWFEGQKYFAGTIKENMFNNPDLEIFKQTKIWLDEYFAGQNPNFKKLPLKPYGNEFRHSVWEILCKIPYGKVTTYGAIARKIAEICGKDRMSAQAVGGAVGHNPVSIIIPCHRVVGSNGALTGYAGGIDTKIKLLKLEKADMSNFFIP